MRAVRAAVAAPLLAAGFSTGVALITTGAAPGAIGSCSAATYAHRVALVVEHGNGGSIRVCIGFDGSSITAEQVLQASGVEYATVSYGSLGDAACQIDHEPASYPPTCWTSTSPYWVLFVARGAGAWSPAARGMSTQTLSDGDAEGFRYDPQNGPEPPPASPAGICAAALAGHSPAPGATVPARSATPSAPSGAAPASAASPPAGTAAPAAGSTPGVTPSPAVIGSAETAPSGIAAAAQSAQGSGPSPALIAASAAGGVLAGLAVVQLVLRRRRA